MNKMILTLAAASALAAGVAHAGLPLTADNSFVMNVSGASASQTYFDRFMLGAGAASTRLCTGPVYKYQNTGNDEFGYACTANQANPTLVAVLGGKENLVIHKRTAGGSVVGVGPQVNGALPITMMNVFGGGCNVSSPIAYVFGNTTTVNACEATALVKPTFGLSDVAPLNFTSTQSWNIPNPNPAGSGLPITVAINNTQLTNVPGAKQIFGVVVNTIFRDALQANQLAAACVGQDTSACMPSLTLEQATRLIKWGTAPGIPTTALGRVHTCGRVNGSGTKAVAAIRVCKPAIPATLAGNSGCEATVTIGNGNTALVAPSAAGGLGNSAFRYHEMSGAGDVAECLSELNQGAEIVIPGKFDNTPAVKKWAIGYQATDNNAFTTPPGSGTTGQYRFVKLAGQEPTIAKATPGLYKDINPTNCIYNKTVFLPTSDTAKLITQICTTITSLPVRNLINPLVAKHLWGQAGFY